MALQNLVFLEALESAISHDKRLDWLAKAPDGLLMDLMEHGECPWRSEHETVSHAAT